MHISFTTSTRVVRTIVTAAAAMSLIAGCASRLPVSSTTGTTLVRTGTVVDVRDVDVRGGQASGLASAVGAILGGVAGSTIGSGTGSAVAAAGGAIAGGVAGQYASERANASRTVQVRVKFEGGEEQVYQVEPTKSFKKGDVIHVTTTTSGTQLSH